jgi:hypothetical protein
MPTRFRSKPVRATLAIGLAISFARLVHAAPPMLPGAWEQTSVFEIIDNETRVAKKLSEGKTTACFTSATLVRPPLSPEKITRLGGRCEPARKDADPARASEVWRMSCESADGKKYRMVSEMSYTETAMRGTLLSVTEYRGEVIEGRMTMEGRRIGECKPDMVVLP